MLRLLALAAIVAAAAPSEAPERAAARLLEKPPEPLAALAASVRNADRVAVAPGGSFSIEGVRRRLGLVDALSGAAAAQLDGGSLETRLGARLLVGIANQRLADDLSKAPAPDAASGEAAGPWREQMEQTLARLRWTAAAHLRSCAALSRSASQQPELGRACSGLLTKIPGIPALPEVEGEAAVKPIAAARAPELQACIEEHPSGTVGAEEPLEARARLELDGNGAVARASLSGPEGRQALYDCLSARLRLWAFPGLPDAEIELPVRLSARER